MSDNLTGLATREQRPNLHYDLMDPQTGNKYPPLASRGWAYGPEAMKRLIAEGKILWPPDPSGRPRLKRFLNEIRSQFTGFSSVRDVGYTTDGTREIEGLFGERVFAFPKPVALLRMLCEQTTKSTTSDIVLDFFAGSCTTAQAVLELNRDDGGNRQFIMVQLPEPTDDKELRTIADIGKERIRRAIADIKKANEGKLDLRTQGTPEDLGFKVFKLAESNYKPWSGVEERDPGAYGKTMGLFTEPLMPGWKAENVIWEVAVKEGFCLSARIEPVSGLRGNTIYRVTDPDKGQSFRICLDDALKPAALKGLNLGKNDLFICRDAALTDESAANLALQCRLKTI
jgi:adenine-specific DNA-methyltransferase